MTVNGYVNAVAGFPDSPKIINGASDLFIEVFGDAGRHVRAAIGVPALPRNALVELQMTVEVWASSWANTPYVPSPLIHDGTARSPPRLRIAPETLFTSNASIRAARRFTRR